MSKHYRRPLRLEPLEARCLLSSSAHFFERPPSFGPERPMTDAAVARLAPGGILRDRLDSSSTPPPEHNVRPPAPAPAPFTLPANSPTAAESQTPSESLVVSLPPGNPNAGGVVIASLRTVEVAPPLGTQPNDGEEVGSPAPMAGAAPSVRQEISTAVPPLAVDEMSVRAALNSPEFERPVVPPPVAITAPLFESPQVVRLAAGATSVGTASPLTVDLVEQANVPQAPQRSGNGVARETRVPRSNATAEPTALLPRAATVLAETIRVDLAAVEAALRQFLDQGGVPRAGRMAASSWLELSSWLVAAGVLVHEVLCHRQARTRFTADVLWTKDEEVA